MSAWVQKKNTALYETIELILGGVVPMTLIVVGTFGNLISVAIFLNKENRRTTTNIYLIFLCLMDTISLYQWNLSRALHIFTEGQRNMWGRSLFMCKLNEFFPFYVLHTSAMFLTCVELDRACLLRSAWYKRKIARPRIALIICAVILIVIFGLNAFLFALGFEYTTYDTNTDTYQTVVACYYSMNPELNDFYRVKYPWIHLVVMYLLPFTVMILCTLLTVKKLIFKQPTTTNHQFVHSAQRNRRISIMLLFMCLTYMVTTLPNRLCFSLFFQQLVGHEYTDTVFVGTNTLMYTRCAINVFFLYISVYGFRRDVHNFMMKCFERRLARVQPTNYTLTKNAANTQATGRRGDEMASIELPVIQNP